MAPIIRAFEKSKDLIVDVCLTGQHKEMINQVTEFFDIQAKYQLDLMRPNQTLFDITVDGLKQLQPVLDESKPDVILVQGDTTSAFIGALAGYYKKIKVAHIEAGLRSYNKYSPFPEEMNRKLVGQLADFHFAPTRTAVQNLKNEGTVENVWDVGNTVIDALHLGLKIIEEKGEADYKKYFDFLDLSKRIILVTGHRRESFGAPFENICLAIRDIAQARSDIEFVYPVHMNPMVRQPVEKILKDIPRVHLIEPISYPYLIWLMKHSCIVLTDSGGIQEEAPGLGKPVLVMRDVTERTEGVDAGTARLVGTDYDKIVKDVGLLLDDPLVYASMSNSVNPYGDGHSSERILKHLVEAR